MSNVMNLDEFRPQTFEDIKGQERIKQDLKTQIIYFKRTGVAIPHKLFLGPSGLGKTTLATVLARELGVGFHLIMATEIKKWADLVNRLSSVEEGDLVFIDEIHALPRSIQESLYPVLEDFCIEHYIPKTGERFMKPLKRFTVVGATTHEGELMPALLNRFGDHYRLTPYSPAVLAEMVQSAAKRIYRKSLAPEVAQKLAGLAQGVPRVAYERLKSLMVEAIGTHSEGRITLEVLYRFLKNRDIDPVIGLNGLQRRYLVELERQGRPLGTEHLAVALNTQEETVKNSVEPFLHQFLAIPFPRQENGRVVEEVSEGALAEKTGRGRVITPLGTRYLTLCRHAQKSQGWFPEERLM